MWFEILWSLLVLPYLALQINCDAIFRLVSPKVNLVVLKWTLYYRCHRSAVSDVNFVNQTCITEFLKYNGKF